MVDVFNLCGNIELLGYRKTEVISMEKSIVKKMIFMMAVVIVGGISILFAGTKVMFDNTQEDVRIAYGKTQYGMIDSIFLKEKDVLRNLIHDYAVWDDMYSSIENHNYEWSAENATRFLVESNDGFKLDMVKVFGVTNDYSEAYGQTNLLEDIEKSHVYIESIKQNKVNVDYIERDGVLYLIAMSPVVTNNKRMSNGYYIMAKEYTDEQISDLIASYSNKDEFLHMEDYKHNQNNVLEVIYHLKNDYDETVGTFVFHYNIDNYFRSFSHLLTHVVAATSLILISLLALLKVFKGQFDTCRLSVLGRIRTIAAGDYTFKDRSTGNLEIKEITDELNKLTVVLKKNKDDSKRYHLNAMTAIIDTIEEHDRYMVGHSKKVMAISSVIGKCLGIEDTDFLEEVALLHDVGKIGLPSEILNKQAPLTAEEYKLVRSHTVRGEKILSSIPYLEDAARIVRQHHERYDGGGYPDHLSGEKIDIVARIIALADSFEAMTADRPYRGKYEFYQAVAIVKKEIGKQFDERVVVAFLEGLHQIKVIVQIQENKS